MYSRAVETLNRLKADGLHDLRVAMTILPENVSEVEEVFRMASQLGVEFTATVAHNSSIYFRKDDNVGMSSVADLRRFLRPVVLSHLKSRRVKDWYRAYHVAGLYSPEIRAKYVGECEAGRRYIFVAPNGDIFPCNVMNHKLFNLTEVESWAEGFSSAARRRANELVCTCGNDCWMVCNTRSLVISHPLRASYWVFTHKLSPHM
jgi:radical SAM protein with 4Fe4S-binding SPASM domain